MIKAVIIDDERNALESLEWQLQTYCPQVEVAAICTSADKGIEAIRHHRPALIFLDVEMPKKNGFEVLEQFTDPEFDVIFTTAYSQFALKAFRFAALDYLLKPIDADDLVNAIRRYEKKELNVNFREQLELLMRQYRNPDVPPERVSFSTQQSVHFIRPQTVSYCESDSNYTTLYFIDQTRMVITKTLKEVEEVLKHYDFFRIHHSFLVNVKEVKRFIKSDGGMLELNSGVHLPISRQRKEEVMRLLNL